MLLEAVMHLWEQWGGAGKREADEGNDVQAGKRRGEALVVAHEATEARLPPLNHTRRKFITGYRP
jgi:hypothetical protein